MDEAFQIIYIEDPRETAYGIIGGGLSRFNKLHAGDQQTQSLCFALTAPDQEIIGGVIGATYWAWFNLELIWVKEEFRGRGYGERLLKQAESEARERGAKHVYVETFSFQAPEFYKKNGYREFGVLNEFPPGHKKHFFEKSLA